MNDGDPKHTNVARRTPVLSENVCCVASRLAERCGSRTHFTELALTRFLKILPGLSGFHVFGNGHEEGLQASP